MHACNPIDGGPWDSWVHASNPIGAGPFDTWLHASNPIGAGPWDTWVPACNPVDTCGRAYNPGSLDSNATNPELATAVGASVTWTTHTRNHWCAGA